MKLYNILGVFLFFIFSANAQSTDSTKAFPLSQILLEIGKRHPQLISDSARIKVQEETYQQERFNWLPEASVNYQTNLGTNNNLPGGYFGNGIIPSNSRVREAGNGSTILTSLGIAAVNLELYSFGENQARREVAKAGISVEQSNYLLSKFQVQANFLGRYLQSLQLFELIQIQQNNIRRNEEIKRTIHALAVSGIKAGVDTSIADAELSKSKLNLLDLTNNYQQLQLFLAYQADIPQDQIIADTMLVQRMIDNYMILMEGVAETNNHPQIVRTKKQYEYSLQQEIAISKTDKPSVSLQGAAWGRGSSVSSYDEFRSLSKGARWERGNYLLGVGITYSITDTKRRQLQLKTQKAQSAQLMEQIKAEQALVRLQQEQATTELKTAYERIREIPRQLKAAEAAYRQKLALYRNGLSDLIELNTALSILYRAETDYTAVKYQFCQALVNKALAENQVPLLIETLN